MTGCCRPCETRNPHPQRRVRLCSAWALVPLALGLARCSSSPECSPVSYLDEATVRFSPAIDEPATWTFRLQATGFACVAEVAVGIEGAQGDAGLSEVSDAGGVDGTLPACGSDPYASGGSPVVAIGGDKGDAGSSALQSVTSLSIAATAGTLPQAMPSLSYEAYANGVLRFARSLAFSYQSSEPNGEGCGVIHEASVETAP